eukprot:374593_1
MMNTTIHPHAGQGPHRRRHHHGAYPPMNPHETHRHHGHEHVHNNNNHGHNNHHDHCDCDKCPNNGNTPLLRQGVFEMSGVDISDVEKSFPAYYECELRPNGLLYGVRDKKLQCFGRWKEVDHGKGLITFTLEWKGDHYQYQGRYNKDLQQFGGQWTILDSKKKENKGENGSFLYTVYYKNPLPESQANDIRAAL